jgi:Ca2+-binding EF-hand superfamily protein
MSISDDDQVFYNYKITACFHHLDQDYSGFITAEQIRRLGERVIEEVSKSAPVTQEQADKVRRAADSFWHAVTQMADANGDGRIALDEYIDAFRTGVMNRPEGFDETFGNVLLAFKDILDVDGNNSVSYNEFAALHRAYNIGEEATRAAFDRLDLDHSGELDMDEFARAAREYYQDTDRSAAGNDLWGALDIRTAA